jgi:hypothetical protein
MNVCMRMGSRTLGMRSRRSNSGGWSTTKNAHTRALLTARRGNTRNRAHSSPAVWLPSRRAAIPPARRPVVTSRTAVLAGKGSPVAAPGWPRPGLLRAAVHQLERAAGGSGGMAGRGSIKADFQIKTGSEKRGRSTRPLIGNRQEYMSLWDRGFAQHLGQEASAVQISPVALLDGVKTQAFFC